MRKKMGEKKKRTDKMRKKCMFNLESRFQISQFVIAYQFSDIHVMQSKANAINCRILAIFGVEVKRADLLPLGC